jgi:hypothetical protein
MEAQKAREAARKKEEAREASNCLYLWAYAVVLIMG